MLARIGRYDEYGRRYHRCTGVHRRVNLHEALVQSCNTYFYDLGARISIGLLGQYHQAVHRAGISRFSQGECQLEPYAIGRIGC